MIRLSAIAAVVAGAFFVCAAAAQAAQDPITAPLDELLAPILGTGGPAPAAAPKAAAKRHARHHAASRHHGLHGKRVATRGKGGYAKAGKAGRKQASLSKRGRKV